jgi:hypothetical protein
VAEAVLVVAALLALAAQAVAVTSAVALAQRRLSPELACGLAATEVSVH